MKTINKELESFQLPCENIQNAIDMIKNFNRKADEYLVISSIISKKVSSKIDYKQFIMSEEFNMVKPKICKCNVYLFVDVIVFTTPVVNIIFSFAVFKKI